MNLVSAPKHILRANKGHKRPAFDSEAPADWLTTAYLLMRRKAAKIAEAAAKDHRNAAALRRRREFAEAKQLRQDEKRARLRKQQMRAGIALAAVASAPITEEAARDFSLSNSAP